MDREEWAVRNYEEIRSEIEAFVRAYRHRCLWFLSCEYLPATPEQALEALSYIERYGDRRAFVRAGELRQWLLPNSKSTSVGSSPQVAEDPGRAT